MPLEKSFQRLSVSAPNNSLPPNDLIQIRIDQSNNAIILQSKRKKVPPGLQQLLNKLLEYDMDLAEVHEDLSPTQPTSQISKLKTLVTSIKDHFKFLTAFSSAESMFLSRLSLLIASFKISELLAAKGEEDTTTAIQIDKIKSIYYGIIQTFKSYEQYPLTAPSKLLSSCSLIPPLLVTISFSLRLDLHSSATLSLTKILALVVVYHLRHPALFGDIRSLVCGPSTANNSFTPDGIHEKQQKTLVASLWEKIINSQPISDPTIYESSQGPISILNNLQLLFDCTVTETLVDEIIPHTNIARFLSRLSCSLRTVHPLLDSLSVAHDEDTVSYSLGQIVSVTHSDFDVQVMKILLRTMSFETGFLQLQSQYPRIKPQLLLLLHRLGSLAFVSLPSSSSSSDETTGFNQDLHYMTATLDSPILHSLLQKPYYANYKVLFELIDHNVKLNICQDFQTSLMLERSLVSIFNNFSLEQDHSTVSDLGSLFSFEGIICNSSFVINSLLLQHLNPTTSNNNKKQIHQSVTTMFDDLRRFPPLPKSEFFDFESVTPGLSKTYLDTVHGFERICLSSELCLGILLKNLKVSNKQVTLESSDLNLQYRSTDLLLQLYFETLFVHLIVSQELSNKSALKEFTDWKSMANVMKLQVFQNFSALFEVYGSFALYKLVLFISEISLRDLQLQRLGLKLLKHLVSHCENFPISELIRKPLVEYVQLWDDGTGEYDQFYELLKLNRPTASISLVPLDTSKFLRLLSQFTEVDEQSPVVSLVSMDSNTSASPVSNQQQSSYPYLYNSANMPNTSGYNGSIPSSNSTRQSSYSGSSNNQGYRNIVSSTQSFIPTKQNKYPNLSASNSEQISNINNNQNNYNYNYNGQGAGGRNSTQRGVSMSHLPNSSATGHEQYGGNVNNNNYNNHLNGGNSGRTMSMNHGSYGI